MQSRLILAIFLTIAIFACNNQPAGDQQSGFSEPQLQEQQKLWDEVMAIHDDVMPKMSDINRLTQALKVQAAEAEGEAKSKIETALKDLAIADEKMWDWMYALKQLTPLRDSLGHEAIMQYLGEEKSRIEKVRVTMLKAIQEGQSLAPENMNK